MHFWNLLSHDVSGGTARTYKVKKLLLFILAPNWNIVIAFHLLFRFPYGYVCMSKQLDAERRDQ